MQNLWGKKCPYWKALLIIVPLPLLICLWVASLRVSGNIHVVEDGVFYRSAQLGADQLVATVEHYGIRTIINLRGPAPGQEWYEIETQVARQLEVGHIDISMNAERELDAATLQELVNCMRECPKPVLVHCKAGADRTGFASALYLAVIRQKPAIEAASQLSLRYGHFPYMYSKTEAMDRTLAKVLEKKP